MTKNTEYKEDDLKNILIEVINLSNGPNDLDKKTNAKIASSIYLSKGIVESSDKLVTSNEKLIKTIIQTSKNNNKLQEIENDKKISAEKENINRLIESNKLLSESNEKYSKGMLYATIAMAIFVFGQIIVGVISLFTSGT